MSNLWQQLNGDMSAIVEKVRRSLVQISNGRGAGAGTIWHADGLIVVKNLFQGIKGLLTPDFIITINRMLQNYEPAASLA